MTSKESQNRYFNANFDKTNPFNPQRPQTPLSNLSGNLSPNNVNRSYQKNGNYNQQYNQYQRNNISKSRVSVNSSSSQLANLNQDQADIFPEDLIFLLSNEEKNINSLKDKIQREKQKVENDFAVFKMEIEHILEDIKISVQAELDLVYKTFITKYAELKGEVQELRMMRKEILLNNKIPSNGNFNNITNSSNKDLINEIEKDAEHLRNYRIYGYLGELQRQKLEPILELSNELILIGAADCPFYKNKEMNVKFKDVKHNFASFIKEVFDNLTSYVITPSFIVEHQRLQAENSKAILKDIEYQHQNENSKLRAFDQHFPANIPRVVDEDMVAYGKTISNPKRSTTAFNTNQPTSSKRVNWVSSNEQVAVTKWCDEIRLNQINKIETDHQDAILCIYFVNDRFIATGSKDKTINIYNIDGKKVSVLKGHDASICCLSSIRNLNGDVFLASGSDYGCSSLILWDTRSWTISSRIQSHTAAVTAIVDLEDGRHLITGSYDKKMNLYNHSKRQLVYTLNNNNSSVTGMVMSVDKSKIITSGLDNSLTVWQIIRKNNIVEEIQFQKTIMNNSWICQIQSSVLRPQSIICATRDGNVKIFNIKTGQLQKTYTVNSNSLIELIVLERQMKNDCPLVLTCSSKDNSLVMTRMDTGISSLIKTTSSLGIQFGCGIGPKIVISQAKDGIMAILNQNANQRQFSLYEFDLK